MGKRENIRKKREYSERERIFGKRENIQKKREYSEKERIFGKRENIRNKRIFGRENIQNKRIFRKRENIRNKRIFEKRENIRNKRIFEKERIFRKRENIRKRVNIRISSLRQAQMPSAKPRKKRCLQKTGGGVNFKIIQFRIFICRGFRNNFCE